MAVSDSGTTGNLIEGNAIGTNASGTVVLANGAGGITEGGGAQGDTIGGNVAGAGNLVVGQTIPAVETNVILITSDNLVAGNLIDSNLTGTAVLSQAYSGITVNGSNNTIGGTVAAARNIVPNDSIWLQSGAQGNLVEGNIAGLDITGTVTLSGYGRIEVDGPNNTIGGTVAGSANVIAGNAITGESGRWSCSAPPPRATSSKAT